MTEPRQNPPSAPPQTDTGTQPMDTAAPAPGPARPTTPTLAPGTALGGYTVERLLGVGGMGAVYLAADPKLGRRVAIKTMRPDLAADPVAKDRFLREARTTAAVEHENVVAVFTVGEDGDTPYLVMPLLKGESLDVRLKRGPVPLADACRIAREVASGLAAAHAQGLIHRDVKPSNVWLDPDGKAKLLDFGLARPMAAGEGLTALGAVVGTPAYMAPEQAGGEAVDARTDLFSLGCVLYQLATGRRPFGGSTVLAVLTSLATHTPIAADRVNPSVPPELGRLIDRLLAKAPAARPGSAKEVAGLLLLIEAGLKMSGVRAIPLDAPPAVPPAGGPDWSALTEDDGPASGGRKPPVASSLGDVATGGLRPPLAKSGRGPLIAAGLAVLLAGAAAVVAFQVIRVETPKGTLVIEADDPDVEVVVKKGGAVIRDKTKDREIELTVGDYEIDLAEKKDGLRLSTRRFTITKGGKETVRVTLAKPPAKGGPPAAADPPIVDPQRAAAAEAAFPELDRKLAAPGVTAAAADVQAFVGAHGGTPAAVRAADRLTRLPSPLDALDPTTIPDDATAAWKANGFDGTDVVAVLGDHRQRHWADARWARYTAGGKRVVTADGNAAIRVWDAATLTERAVLREPGRVLRAWALSPDGTRLLTSHDSPNLVILWDPETGKVVRRWDNLPERIRGLAISADNRTAVFGLDDKSVRVMDVATGEERHHLKGHTGLVTHVAVSPDGRQVLSSDDTTVRLWDAIRGKELRAWAEPGAPVFAPDGRHILCAKGSALHLWDVAADKDAGRFEGHTDAVRCFAFSSDGRRLLTGGREDKSVRLWDTATGRELLKLDGHVSWVNDVAFLPGDTRAVSAGQDGRLFVWDLTTGRSIRSLAGHAGWVVSVAASPDGRLVVSAGDDGTVRLWDVDAGKEVRPLTGPVGPTTTAAFAPDLSGLLTIHHTDGYARLWGWGTGVPAQTAPLGGAGDTRRAAWFPDGKRYVVIETPIRIHDAATGAVTADLPTPPGLAPLAVAVSPDGARAAVGAYDGSVLVWDTAATPPKLLHTFTAHAAQVVTVAFAPDGRRLATGGNDHVARVWDLTANPPKQLAQLGEGIEAGNANVYRVAWSPDGAALAVARGLEVEVWAVSGKAAKRERAMPHGNRLTALAVHPTGARVAAADVAGRVVVWNPADGAKVREWQFPGPVHGVAFAADGRHLAAANGNGTTYVLRVAPVPLTARPSPLDALAPGKVPDDATAAWRAAGFNPADVVAVLGDHRGRPWDGAQVVAYSPDGKTVASGGGSHTTLWDADTLQPVATLPGPSHGLLSATAIAFSPSGKRLTVVYSNQCWLWEIRDQTGAVKPRQVGEARALDETPNGRAVFTDEGRAVLVGSKHFAVVDVVTGAVVKQFGDPGGPVNGACVSADGRWLLMAHTGLDQRPPGDRGVRLWDLQAAQPGRFFPHDKEVVTVAFSPDARRFVSGDSEGTVSLWDVGTGRRVRSWKAHDGLVYGTAVLPDDRHALTAGLDGAIHLWDVGTANKVRSYAGHNGRVLALSAAADGRRFATAGQDGTVRLWDVDTGREVRPLAAGITAVALAPDCAAVAAGGADGAVRVWESRGTAFAERSKFPAHADPVSVVRYSADGRLLLTAGGRQPVKVWDLAKGGDPRAFGAPSYPVLDAAISPDGRLLALTEQYSNNVPVFDVRTGAERHVLKDHPQPVRTVAFSPDGRSLAVGIWDGDVGVTLWDLRSPRVRHQLPIKDTSGGVHSVAWSPDGTALASAIRGHRFMIWDAATGTERVKLPSGAEGFGTDYSPDGRLVATCLRDGRVILRDAAAGGVVREWQFPGPVNGVAFAADGRHLVTANGNGTVYVLRLAPPPGPDRVTRPAR